MPDHGRGCMADFRDAAPPGLTELLEAGVFLRLQVLASSWLLCTTQEHSSICLFLLKS